MIIGCTVIERHYVICVDEGRYISGDKDEVNSFIGPSMLSPCRCWSGPLLKDERRNCDPTDDSNS